MNISGVSFGQFNMPVNNSQANQNEESSENRRIQILENQKIRLEDQLEKVKKSDCDSKMKKRRINEIKSQIQEIESQIQQVKLENLTKNKEMEEYTKNKKDENFNKKKDKANDTEIDSSKIQHLTKIDTIYSEMKELSKVRTDLKGKARVLEGEIALDSSRGADVSHKAEELGGVNGRLQGVENSIMGKGYKVQKEVEKSNDDEKNTKKTKKIQDKESQNSNKNKDLEKLNLNKDDKDTKNKEESKKSLDFYI